MKSSTLNVPFLERGGGRWKEKINVKIALTVYLHSLSKSEASGPEEREKKINRNTHTVFFFQTGPTSQTALRLQLIWFSTNIVFSTYDGAMLLFLHFQPRHLCGKADGEENTQGGLCYWEKVLAWPPPSLHFCLLSTSCPAGHKCISSTCNYPTSSVTL